MTTTILCLFCGEPVDPDAPTVARHVTAFCNLTTGETVNLEPTGAFAHGRCVNAAEFGAPPQPMKSGGRETVGVRPALPTLRQHDTTRRASSD